MINPTGKIKIILDKLPKMCYNKDTKKERK
jgi:hypothetical protein